MYHGTTVTHGDNDGYGAPPAIGADRPIRHRRVGAEGWTRHRVASCRRGRSGRIRCCNAQGGGDVSVLVNGGIEWAAQHVLSIRSRHLDGAVTGTKIVPGQVECARAGERPPMRDRD
jgi:hypothetical protein